MSEIIYTTEQKRAMELRDRNLLISAAAGAGKTSVMVERIVRMATAKEKQVGLDRMLVVTFTNAAAAEMKERIRKALYNEIKKSPSDTSIRKQLILINQANISTIHSFCSEVIRSNYHLLDIDPAFSVSDEMESTRILRQSIEEVLSEKYDEMPEGLEALVNTCGRGRDDEGLVKMLLKLYGFLRSMPEYLSWLDEKTKLLTTVQSDFINTPWGQVQKINAEDSIEGLIAQIKAAAAINEKIGGPEVYEITAAKDIELLEGILNELETADWNGCCEVLAGYKFSRLESARGFDDALKSIFKGSRDKVKKELKRIASGFAADEGSICEISTKMIPMFKVMNEILHIVDVRYTDMKRRKGILDYNDLEHLALECLKGDAGSMYRRKFMEVFVDEYQDSNSIQEEIICLVSGRDRCEKNIFMVGDLKQSIYRFRHADPELFQEKYNRYSENEGDAEVRIELSNNYRSRKEILDFNNMIFDRLMTPETADLDYKGNARLEAGIEYDENTIHDYSVEVIVTESGDKLLYDASLTKEDKEAAVVGARIIELVESGFEIFDKNKKITRPVEFRDITILMRSLKNASERYVEILGKMGIPAKSNSSSDFFSSYEIIVLRSYLAIIDNPRQDIPLLTVLRSSMYSFTDRELMAIKCESKAASFYEKLTEFKGNSVLLDKINIFLEAYNEYCSMIHYTPVDKLIWLIMTETGFYYRPVHSVSLESGQANLRRLFELAGSYEQQRGTGVHGFLVQLRNLEESDKDISGSIPRGRSNEVNIMSIHKSKGLEFPVVILSGTGKGFNRSESREALLWDRDMGFGADYVNYDKGYKIKTIQKKCLQTKGNTEDTREELRILYVAMTRAREKLIITGSVKNTVTQSLNWILTGVEENNSINKGKVLGASSHLEWIMAALTGQKSGRRIFEEAEIPVTGTTVDDEASFGIKYVYPAEVLEMLEVKSEKPAWEEEKADLDYKEIEKRFSWRYPYEGEAGIHKKVSVTELKKMTEGQKEGKDIFGYRILNKPSFLESDDELSATERGTLVHNVLAAIDYKKLDEVNYIENLLIKAGAPKENLAAYLVMTNSFINSDLGMRAANSSNIVQEKSFIYPIKATRVYPEKEGLVDPGLTIMLQGIVDCMFFEDGNIVIIDYKTDRVENGNENTHAMQYKLQLDLYTEAVEGLTGLGVSERYIFFLRNGAAVRI